MHNLTVVYYINCVAVTWAKSADKHGIAHEDVLHAIGNAYYVEEEFDEPRVPGAIRPTLFIGPQRQLENLDRMEDPL